MGAMEIPLPEAGLREGPGCAARRMWRGAVAALESRDPDAAWQRVLDNSPPDSLWHSLRNCVAYQAGVWQNLLNKGIDDVLQPAAFKLAIVLRHTPTEVTVRLLADLLRHHPQARDLTSYIVALLTDDEAIFCGGSSSSPSPNGSRRSATSGEGRESADGEESGEGGESADGGESGDSGDSGASDDSDSSDSGDSNDSAENAEVTVEVHIKPPVMNVTRRDDLPDTSMVPDSTTGADSTTGPDNEAIASSSVSMDSREVAVGEVTEGLAASEAAAAAAAEGREARAVAVDADEAEAAPVVDSTNASADLELVFGGAALGEALGAALGEAIAAAVSSAAVSNAAASSAAMRAAAARSAAARSASTPAGPAPLRDLQLFGDCELAVLAASRVEYDAHAKLVRAEYSKLTNDNYVDLRIKVLNQFAQIPKLYHTPEFECFEAAARENIEREIGTLQEHLLTGRGD